MKAMETIYHLFIVLFLLFLTSIFARAADPALKNSERVVKEIIHAVNQMHPEKGTLTTSQLKQNKEMKRQIANRLDMKSMSTFVLADAYKTTNQEDLRQFKKLFRQLILKSATSQASKNKVKIKIRRKKKVTRDRVIIKTKVRQKGEDPVILEYVLKIEPTKQPLVVDLVLDEESILENYRDQFQEIIKKHNIKELIKRLKKNVS